jgi:DNA-binding NtrC family response regulator
MSMKNILVVDDQAAYLLALKKILHRPWLRVDIAATVEHALILLQDSVYDVVITDLKLGAAPGEDGISILKSVKEWSPSTRVIMITGYGHQDIIKKAFALGVDCFYEKPLSSEILKKTLLGWGVEC